MEEDITKTGPVGLKGLKGLSQNPSKSSQYFNNLSQLSPTEIADNYLPEAQRYIGVKLGQAGYGESTYDESANRLSQIDNLGDIRALEQSNAMKIINGVGKGAVLAGSTFVNGTAGLVVGIGQGIANLVDDNPNTGFWSGMWDNAITQATQALSEASENWMPNYYTKNELEEPWYKNINANFIGDKLLKNTGFAVGAVYSGNLYSAAFQATKIPQLLGAITKSTRLPAAATSLVGASLSAVGEGSIEALQGAEEWYAPKREALDAEVRGMLQDAQNQYAIDSKTSQLVPTSFDPETGMPVEFKDSALAKYEANEKAIKEYYAQALDKLEQDKIKVGNTILELNYPLLTLGNYIQFGREFSKGFKTGRKVKNIIKKDTEYAVKDKGLRKAKAIILDPITEANEEFSQSAITNIAQDYYDTDVNNFYKAKKDPDAEQETLSWMKAAANGLNKTANDDSAWEGAFIGGLTGAAGIPIIRSTRAKDGSRQSPITMVGGIKDAITEVNEEIAKEQEVADYLTGRIQDPKFLNYYQGFIRRNKIQADKEEALENDDKFAFENASHAEMVSDIIMFDNAGRLDDLIELVDNALDTSDENLEAIRQGTTTTTEDDTKTGPFADSFYVTPEGKEEMRKELNKAKEEVHNTIQNYRKAKDYIDTHTYGQLSNDQLEELTWMKSQLSNWAERAVDMSGEVKQGIQSILHNLTSQRDFAVHVKNSEGKEHAELTELYLKADQSEQELNKAIDFLNSLLALDNNNFAAILAKNPQLVEGIIKELSHVKTSILSVEARDDIFRKLNDIVRLGNASDVYAAKLEEYLNNPENQSADHRKADLENIQKKQQKDIVALKEEAEAAKTKSELNSILDNAPNPDIREAALNELIDEGNDLAKNYKEVSNYDSKIRKAITTENSDESSVNDALTLWGAHIDSTETLEQAQDMNSPILNDEDFFIEEMGRNTELSRERTEKAKFLIQEAIAKVSKNNRTEEDIIDSIDNFYEQLGNSQKKSKSKTKGKQESKELDNSQKEGTENDEGSITEKTLEEVKKENKELNDNSIEGNKIETEAQYTFYRPAIPELHIDASKEGDFRPFPIIQKERNAGDYTVIYEYLEKVGAFKYVNESNLKPGDTLGFMIDPEFNDHTIFIVDIRNNQIVGSLNKAESSLKKYKGLTELVNKVKEEYKNSKQGDTKEKFYASPSVKVSEIMIGKIPYIEEEKDLTDIPGVLDGEKTPILGVIRRGEIETNGALQSNSIHKKKQGQTVAVKGVYLLIPNAASTYSPVSLRVKRFSKKEFNLHDAVIASTPIGEKIRKFLENYQLLKESIKSQGRQDLLSEISKYLYLQDVLFIPQEDHKGIGVRIVHKLRNPDGSIKFINKNGEQIPEEKSTVIYFQTFKPNIEIDGFSYTYEAAKQVGKDIFQFIENRDSSDVMNEILETLYSFDLPFQVSASSINKNGYNEELINSGILTSNLREAKVIGSWFKTTLYDPNENIKPKKPLKSFKDEILGTSPIGGTEEISNQDIIELNGTQYKVEYADRRITDLTTQERLSHNTKKFELLLELGWAQMMYGDEVNGPRMIDNQVITPSGKVLDRNTKKYLSEAETQEAIQKIHQLGANYIILSEKPSVQETKDEIQEAESSLIKSFIPNQEDIQKDDSLISYNQEFDDDLLFRKADGIRPIWNQEEELAWLDKVLPQLSAQDKVKMVKGLIQVAENGPTAWGMFSEGIITLSDIAAKGTAYHEAFHVVFHLMMSQKEREALFEEARSLFGDKSLLELEEAMAEGFREYVMIQEERGFGRKMIDFFKNLFAKVTNWKFISPSLNSYYRMIDQGRYKRSPLKEIQITRLRSLSNQQLSESLDTEYALAKKEIERLNYRRFNTEQEAKDAFNSSGIDPKLFYRITRAGVNNAIGYKIQILTNQMFNGYKKAILENQRKQTNLKRENFYFDSLDPDVQMELLNKGWTKKEFDRISQEERDNAIECVGL